MVYKKKKATKKRYARAYMRRRYRRGFRRNMRLVKMPGVSSFPDRIRVKLSYCQEEAITSFATTVIYRPLRGNGPFDPDALIGGVQPLAFDQWSAFYNKVCVRACKIKININNTGVGTGAVIVLPSTQLAAYSTSLPLNLQEQPYAKTAFVGTIDSGTGNKYLKHYMTSNKILGVPPKSVGIEDDYQSLVTATPAKEWFWHVYLFEQVATFFDPTLTIRLTYYCEFFDRKPMPQS